MNWLQKYWTKLGLLLIITIYLLIAFSISQVTPFNKGPDEETNLAYITFITRYGRLPITYDERLEVGKDSNWPALYHLMVAGLSRTAQVDREAIDTGPYIKVLWDSFRYRTLDTGDEPTYYLRTEDQLPPYQGRFLVWQIGRWLSMFWGVITLLLLYRLILELLPNRPDLALFGVALLAFQPVFIFISAVLNEDTLMAALTTLYLWLLIRFIKQPTKTWLLLLVGLILGLSITIKYTTIVLPPQIIGVLIYLKYRYGYSWAWLIQRTVLAGLATIIGTSWWFGWNFWYLNEIDKHGWYVGLLRPIFTGGPDVTLARLGYLLSGGEIGLAEMPLRNTTLGTFPEWLWFTSLSFWGVKAGEVWPGFPLMFIGVMILLLVATWGIWRLWRTQPTERVWLMLFASHIGLFILLPIIRFGLSRRIGETAQGRHILVPAVGAVIILIGWGLATVIPKYWQRLLFPLIIVTFIGWSVAHWHRLATFEMAPLPMRTAQLLEPVAGNSTSSSSSPELVEGGERGEVSAMFGDTLTLLDYQITPQPTQSALALEFVWQTRISVKKNYLLSVMVLNQDDMVVSHWLGHPGQGRMPTLAWQVGDTIVDRLRLPLSDLPVGDYRLQLQFLTSSQTPEPFGEPVSMPFRIETATSPIDSSRPIWNSHQPASWWLTKADTAQHRYPGTITVLSSEQVQLVDEAGTIWQSTRSEANSHSFVIGPRWLSGAYQLQTSAGNTLDTLTITNWWEREFNQPDDIQSPQTANFANQLQFLGYSLPNSQVKAGDSFPLTLYWQAMPHKAPEAEFLQFNNLLDEHGTLWGGYDREPLEYYNTLLWTPGEVVVDGYAVPVDPNAPPGLYYLDVGYYLTLGEGVVNLPLVVDGQRAEQSSVTIGPIEVVEKE
ncbi:glycosyltransferase family 39 protein [Anaerolineales bacterium HSG6]|nr:glycosyltransferase family 39 protein [Anaerolineales bacterium HSG6]